MVEKIVESGLKTFYKEVCLLDQGFVIEEGKKSVAQAVKEAEAKVGLKMNISRQNLAKLLKSLPALRNPTISNLSLEGWVAVETIIDEHIVRELIPALKAAGAEGREVLSVEAAR